MDITFREELCDDMKRKVMVLVGIMAILFAMVLCFGPAMAEEVDHTIIFHSGSDGIFENGFDTNVVEYGSYQPNIVTKYAHTPNISDDGTVNERCPNSYVKTDVVTIPGAKLLHVVLSYGTVYSDSEYVCMWAGNQPGYTASSNYGSSITQRLGGTSATNGGVRVVEYDVFGDSVTFGFRCSTYSGDRYGYYAVVSADVGSCDVLTGTYDTPQPTNEYATFSHWSLSQDDKTQVFDIDDIDEVSEDIDLYAVYNYSNKLTFYSGAVGTFAGGSDTNVVSYSAAIDPVVGYLYTPNLNKRGEKIKDYPLNYMYTQTIEMLGADYLDVQVTYSGGSGDTICLWEGNHPNYVYTSGYPDPYKRLYCSSNALTGVKTETIRVLTDSVTICFKSDYSDVGNGYGYYAVVTGYFENPSESSGRYAEPVAHSNTAAFAGWKKLTANDDEIVPYDELSRLEGEVSLIAVYSETRHKINFHSGEDGRFVSDDLDLHIVTYGAPVYNTQTQYVHTSNICDDGVPQTAYQNNRNEKRYASIAGASNLYVRLKYATDTSYSTSSDRDGVCIWSGQETSYTVLNNADSSLVGRLDGGDVSGNSSIKNYVFSGNTLTFGFHSNNTSSTSDMNVLYGFYAEVSDGGTIYQGVYEEPEPYDNTKRFKEWNTEPDGSGKSYTNVASISEDTDLYAIYEETIVRCGVYRDVDWRMRGGDYAIILGKQGKTQTYRYYEGQNSWPYSSVSNIIFEGTVVGTGSMDRMFLSARFTDIDLTNFDMSLVTDMSYMFYNCDKIAQIDLSGCDLHSVLNMERCFSECAILENVNLSGQNLSNVKNMSYMFSASSSINTVDFSNTIVSSVEKTRRMFEGCSRLSYLDLSGFDFSHVIDESLMYNNCSSLTRFKFGENNPVVRAEEKIVEFPMGWSYALEDSDPLIGPYTARALAPVYTSDYAGIWVKMEPLDTAYAVYDTSSDTLYFLRSKEVFPTDSDVVQTVTSMSGTTVSGVVYAVDEHASQANNGWSAVVSTAKHVKALDEIYLYDAAPHDWFKGFSACEDMDLLKFDVSAVKSCREMFRDCSALIELDLSTWEPFLATDVSSMFYNCSALQKLDIGHFSLRSCTQQSAGYGIFGNCTSLEELNIAGIETAYSIDFRDTLTNLKRIKLGIYPGYYGTATNGVLPCISAWWTREDGAYGPYSSADFGLAYDHWSINDSAEKKDREGWYVRSPGVVAVYCPNTTDDYSLYFLKTDSYNVKSGSYATISRVGDDRTYTGIVYYLPTTTDGEYSYPKWYGNVGGTRHIIVLDEFAPIKDNLNYWFAGLSTLKSIDLQKLDMSNIVGMNRTFNAVKVYNDDVDLGYLDVSHVVDMEYCFEDARFKTLDLTGWDVSNVEKPQGLFREFDGHLIAPDFHWDSAESGMGSLFGNSGNNVPSVMDVPRWSFGKVKDCSSFFYYCYAEVNAQDWNLDGVTTIQNCFRGSNGNTKHKVDISGWHSDTLTNASYLFAYAYGLDEVDLSDWDMPALNTVAYMFTYATALENIVGLESWTPRSSVNITTTSCMFLDCEVLEKVNLSTWYVPALEDADRMFSSCKLIDEIDLSGLHITDDCEIQYAFNECNSLRKLKIPYFKDVSSCSNLFTNANVLQEITVGSDFVIRSVHQLHSIPRASVPCKWIDDSGIYGPWSTDELIAGYPEGFSGTWLWDIPDTRYYIVFEAPEGTIGSMPMVTVDSCYENYVLPENKYRKPGTTFSYWRDNIKNYTYGNRSTISANYYQPGDVVVLTANFNGDGGQAVNMLDGGFVFKLKKNQTALFDNIPVNTVYQVYEETPYGWELVADSDTSGVIESDKRSAAGFGNKYVANQCFVVLSGLKFFDGELAGDREYTFELIDENGQVVDTTTTRAGGDIVFSSLSFTADDVGHEFYYTVREIVPGSESLNLSTIDESNTYDAHEEKIKIVITYQLRGDGSLYSHTGNLNDYGQKLRATFGVGPYSLCYHTTNMEDDMSRDMQGQRADGSIQGDYVSQKPYAAVVNLRNAVKMHVKLTYSAPRGNNGLFSIWLGEHEEVRSGQWSADCNPGNAYKQYQSGDDGSLLTDEFDIYGNSLSLRYLSTAILADNPAYTEYSNFGYHMEITIDENYMNGGQRSDGTPISDYVDGQEYTDFVQIPGADGLHVTLKYSSPRGDNGAFIIKDKDGAVVKTYPTSGVQNAILQDEFDVDSDALSILYRSDALDLNDVNYNEYSNYGYYIKATPHSLSGSVGRVPFSVSTPNIDQNGIQQGNYETGKDYVNVVSVPGATKLNFTIKFNMGSNDRLRLFEGNHPDYPYDTNFNSVGWMTGYTSSYYTYTVNGDTATLIFHADANSTGGTGYGYYATYTSNNDLTMLQAEVTYDDDGMVYYNKSGPGYLTLTKESVTPYSSDKQFMFEVSFVDDAGRQVDLNTDIFYVADENVLPNETSLVTVYHIGVDRNGDEHIQYVERYPNLVVGDVFHSKAKLLRGYEYVRNDYTQDESAVISGSVTADPLEVHMYYDAVPWTLTVKYAAVDVYDKIGSILDTETLSFYYGEDIIINPKYIQGYEYVQNTAGLSADVNLHGLTMPDGDMGIVLKYRPTRNVVLSHVGGYESRSYRITLQYTYNRTATTYGYSTSSRPYNGLTTRRYGDVEFVDGVAEVTVAEGNDVNIVIPMNTGIKIEPITDSTIPNVVIRSNTTIYSTIDKFQNRASISRQIYDYGTYYFNISDVAYRTLTFNRMFVNENGSSSQSGSYTYAVYPGEIVGNRGESSDISYSYSGKWYCYTGQDVDPNTVVANADITVKQYYGVRRTISVQHIRVLANGTESVANTNTYYAGSYGDFSIPLRSYSGYVFDSAVCSTDSSIVLSGTGPVTGTLKNANITIQIRYKLQ